MFHSSYLRSLVSTVLASGFSVLASAQVLPNAGALLNESQQRKPVPTTPESATPTPSSLGAAAASPPTSDALMVHIKAISFSGDVDLVESESLSTLTQPLSGQTIDHAGLQRLTDTITRYLRGRGYVLARAWLPPQDLTDGTLRIELARGKLESGKDRVRVDGSTRSSNQRLQDIAASALPEGQALQAKDLERALLLINEQPGIHARGTLDKGSDPGTSRLLISAEQGSLLHGTASIDNYGSRSTGIGRAYAGLRLDDPLGVGDQFSLGGSKTSGSDAIDAGYSQPLTSSGLRLSFDASQLRYHVDQDDYRMLDLRGEAKIGSVRLRYPLILARTQSLGVAGTYTFKSMQDNAMGQNVRDHKLDSFALSLDGNRFDGLWGGGNMSGSVIVTHGQLDLSGNELDAQADSLTAQSAGSFTKLNLNLSRLQSLGNDSDWSLYAGLAMQLANNNLDSSEKMLLGGPTGLRSYPVGEASGDEGAMGTLEFRRFLEAGIPNGKLQALVFLDAGQIKLHQSPWSGSVVNAEGANSYHLASVGIGANLWSGNWALRAAMAHGLGDNPGRTPGGLDADGRDSTWRGWLQALYSF
jgi:hemolysin activation/secretion protein